MKNKKTKFILLMLSILLLTGCTKNLKDSENKIVKNEKTGQSVTENIILGVEPVKNGIMVDYNFAKKKVMELSERYGMMIDPDAKIEDISVGMQQRVEILKTLYRGAEILILDEPTAVLTPQEIKEFFSIFNKRP